MVKIPNQKLKVGQVLWWVPRYTTRDGAVTVRRVGRKWATVATEKNLTFRIDVKTLKADVSGSERGHCCLTKQHYLDELAVDDLWRRLRNRLDYQRPQGMSKDAILELAKLIGISLGDGT